MSEEKYGHGISNNNFNIQHDNLIEVVNNEKWSKSELDEFTIKFEGEPVENHQMDANELATSLLGISSVLEHANIIINGQNSPMFVKVRSSFKGGSFDVDIATFFTFVGINTAANIATIIGFTGNAVGTLIWLFKRTKGKKIVEKKVVQGNNYEIKIEGENNSLNIIGNDIFDVDDVLRIYDNVQIRKDLADATQPLKMVGMESISFLKNGKECEKILKDELNYFEIFDAEILNETEGIDDFLITRADFEGRQTGWRLSEGESEPTDNKPNDFSVKILDEDFLKKVKQKEIDVHKGTIIRAKYKKTKQKVDRLSVTWEILQVLKVDYDLNLFGKEQKRLTKYAQI